MAGAEGFEPSPSTLTVWCPTSWTTPQQGDGVGSAVKGAAEGIGTIAWRAKFATGLTQTNTEQKLGLERQRGAREAEQEAGNVASGLLRRSVKKRNGGIVYFETFGNCVWFDETAPTHLQHSKFFQCGCIPKRFVGHYRVATSGFALPD